MPGSLELQQTMNRAKDLMENDIGVYLVPMVDEFDCDLFYKEFLSRVSDEELDAFREIVPEVQRQTLLERITRKNFHKKCLRHINLVLGDGLEISCDLHSFIKLAKKPTAIKMLRDTNEVLVAKRCYVVPQTNVEPQMSADTPAEARPQMDAEPRADAEPQSINAESDVNLEVPRIETTQKLLPGELFKYQEIGGQEVAFSAEELTSLKTLVPPGLRLLGFKPIETLAPRCFVKCCVFLSPSDGLIKGSTKLFRALWEKCLEKGVYALCTLTYRRKVAPRYVALVPQSDDTDGKDGFRVVYVPMESKYIPHWRMISAFDQHFCRFQPTTTIWRCWTSNRPRYPNRVSIFSQNCVRNCVSSIVRKCSATRACKFVHLHILTLPTSWFRITRNDFSTFFNAEILRRNGSAGVR